MSTIQVERLTVDRFDSPMKGATRPFLGSGKASDGRDVQIIVKPRATLSRNVFSSCSELVCAFFAKDLGIPVPTPFLVEITEPMARSLEASDNVSTFDLLRSLGLNFGCEFVPSATVFAETSWETLSDLQRDIAIRIFVFDVLVQNWDRHSNNPNILQTGNSLVAIDHERAFASAPDVNTTPVPPPDIQYDKAYNHVVYKSLPHERHGLLKGCCDAMLTQLAAVDAARIGDYRRGIPIEWSQAQANAPDLILAHVNWAIGNANTVMTEICTRFA